MKKFLVLFREPDGRAGTHTNEEIRLHQEHWKAWLDLHGKQGHLGGGNGLTLNGNILKGRDPQVIRDIHRVGTEIVGGFLLINANDLEEATDLMRSCPIFEFDGYAEIRELES